MGKTYGYQYVVLIRICMLITPYYFDDLSFAMVIILILIIQKSGYVVQNVMDTMAVQPTYLNPVQAW